MSLIAWYPLHRTNGQAVDLSGNDNHGTHNSTTRGVAGKGGLQGTYFNGGSSYLTISRPNIQTNPDIFSASFWIYPTQSGLSWIISPTGASGYDAGIRYENSGISLNISESADTNNRYLRSENSASLNEWSHAVVNMDVSTGLYEIYVNGSFEARMVDTQPSQAWDGNWDIGRRGNGSYYLGGSVHGLRIYDRPLEPEEVQTLYEWGSMDTARPPTDGVARYPLDETSGSTATDVWGNNDAGVNETTIGANGIRDTAYSFSGASTSQVNVGSSIPTSTGDYTLSAWAKQNSDNGKYGKIYFQRHGASGTQDGFNLYAHQNNNWSFWAGNGSGWNVVGGGNITNDIWYHLVLRLKDSGFIEAWVNGERVGRVENSNINSYSQDVTNFRFGQNFDGTIDDVRVYDRLLNPYEIHELYRWGTRGRNMRELTVNQ